MNKVWKNVLSLCFGLSLMTSLTFSFASVDQAELLKENDRQVGVFELQRALKELGYFTGNEFTNLYGKQTIEAVKAFQKSLQMTADGVSGKATLEAVRDHQLSIRKTQNLKLGASGPRVELLGTDLAELGFYKGTPSTKFTAELETALKAFQKSASLAADGTAGDGTLEALTKALAVKRNYVAAATKATAAKTTAAATKAATATSASAQASGTVAATAKATAAKTAETAAAAKATASNQKTAAKATSRGAEAVRKSKTFIGIDYVYGGASSKGFDCSGFTMYVMKQFGVSLPHGATAQYAYGTAVNKADLKEGDLVFFKTTDAPISHVGIYIGNGQFIHASSAKDEVIISSLKTYGGKYVGARRVL